METRERGKDSTMPVDDGTPDFELMRFQPVVWVMPEQFRFALQGHEIPLQGPIKLAVQFHGDKEVSMWVEYAGHVCLRANRVTVGHDCALGVEMPNYRLKDLIAEGGPPRAV